MEPGATSEALSVSLTGADLEADVTVTVANGFTSSLTEDGTYEGDDLTISAASLEDNASVVVYFRAEPDASANGTVSGDVVFSSSNADNVSLSLSANVGIVITGSLFISEFFTTDVYGAAFSFLPVDSAMLGWDLNRDTIISSSTVGQGWPDNPGPNNEMYSHWYLALPLAGATIMNMCPLTPSSSLSITGYPSPAGARAIQLDPDDEDSFYFINENNSRCIANGDRINRNTGAARRFAQDGYTGNATTGEVYLSALVNIEQLGGGEKVAGNGDFGDGDLIFLASNTTGPANNNNVKIQAKTDAAGQFTFDLVKENEGNTPVKSSTKYDLNTTYLLVLSHQFVAGDNNDVTKLYVFAEGDDIPTSMDGLTPVATMDETYTEGVDPVDLNTILIRERNQDTEVLKAQITGIRVGDTWVATLFEDASNAVHVSELASNRIVTDKTSDCNN